MTTAAELIKAAYRESNLISINATVSSAQQTEALTLLNGLIPATIGNEVGDELRDLMIGGTYDQSGIAADWLPENARLVLNMEGASTFKLHPNPYDGQRLAIVDAASNLATYNLTIDGNGRRIENATSYVASTNGLAREWLYRADTANWVNISSLAASDNMPLPREFDDYFRILLAMRLNPAYGQNLQPHSAQWLQEQANRLEARYRRRRPMQEWGSLGLLNQNARSYGNSGTSFTSGRYWR